MSTFTEEQIAHGQSVGLDIEKIRSKYAVQKMTASLVSGTDEDQLRVKANLEAAAHMRKLEGDFIANEHGETVLPPVDVDPSSSVVSGGGVDEVTEANKRLDRLVICGRCQGQGIHKSFYNYQVKDINCDECEGEGLMYKCLTTGKLLKKREAPILDKKRYDVDGIEEKARALAESCGVSNKEGEKAPGEMERLARINFSIDNQGDAPPNLR